MSREDLMSMTDWTANGPKKPTEAGTPEPSKGEKPEAEGQDKPTSDWEAELQAEIEDMWDNVPV